MHPVSLSFDDVDLEREFRSEYFVQSLASNRAAMILAAAQWAVFGAMTIGVLDEDTGIDLAFRFAVLIPSVLIVLGLTFLPSYGRWWTRATIAILLFNGVVWATQRTLITEVGVEWGYAPIMIILAFAFSLTRLRFLEASISGLVLIAYCLLAWALFTDDTGTDLLMAGFFMLAIQLTGMAGAYLLELSRRRLFLSEREVRHERERAERERERAERLLRNVLPDPIAQRLGEMPTDGAAYIADGLDDVAVLFADIVGFTHQASRIPPTELVATLDDLFARFDAIADRCGLEKIKTVGDEYMAVAGAPEPSTDSALAAADMALAIHAELTGMRWPTGDPIAVRIGIASGSAVAGVIGRRKFAYDLWGDTVNLANRLETNSEPSRTLVSEPLYERLRDRFEFSAAVVVDVKGKGPTPARFLVSRR
ncbi:MAG TPA: adenylate/guanylate cyclase domain-containing protein [Acidimicrobiia bacterium]|nr:adenylate/guanylate cyclase domain-containing protein [Acidimicrobiia bacterium]